MRATVPDVTLATDVRFKEYLMENVYLRTTQAQRIEIMALWHEEGALTDQAEAERRSHEAVFLVRVASGELGGLSTVGLLRTKDGRVFYAYRMFLRKRHRVPNLMLAVVKATRDFLKTFRHPELRPAGMLHVNENPKLMRPGARRVFERLGYRYWGTTQDAEDVWAVEFSSPNPSVPRHTKWRNALTRLISCFGRSQENNLDFTAISKVPKPT